MIIDAVVVVSQWPRFRFKSYHVIFTGVNVPTVNKIVCLDWYLPLDIENMYAKSRCNRGAWNLPMWPILGCQRPMGWWGCCIMEYPTKIHHKPKSREISFAYNLVFTWPIVLKFCIEHGSCTAVLCTKFRNDWLTDSDVWTNSISWVLDGVIATLSRFYYYEIRGPE